MGVLPKAGRRGTRPAQRHGLDPRPLPAEERLDFVELGYSPDNRWIHICEWASGRNLLVRSSDGLIVPLPITSSAVSWNPRAGASVMTVMVTDGESGSLVVHDYDLTSDRLSRRSEVRSPTGLPLSVRELSMSVDERAVVTAPVGLVGVEQLRRGGVHIAAVIDVDYGEIDPVLPVRYRTPSTQRRHTSPRWCDDRTVLVASRTVLADQLINAGVFPDCEPDAPTISHDHLNRWLEILDGVEAAWRTSAMPKARFAQDYAQYAISCTEIDPEATEDMLGRLRQLADYETVPRTVLAWISTGYRLWPPLPDDVQSPGTDPTAIHFASDQASAAEKAVGAALDLLVAANRTDEAISAVRQLLYTAHHAGQDPEKVWAWFGSLGFAALRSGSYGFVAKVALATRIWNTVLVLLDRSVTAYGLRPTSSADVLPILLNGFEACTHLPERQILGRNVRHMIDVENLRNWCQAGLSHLPLDDYLTSVARPTRPQIQAPAVPNPAITRDRETESRLVGKKKVFISYLREDAVAVDRLASELASAGIEVWLDRTRLNPAVIWKREIRRAIRDHDYFVACFSSAYAQRGKTYMNEELRLAVEQLRLMPLDRRWFIPVVLDACRVPDFDIDATTTLEDLQYLDFAEDWDTAMAKLINLIHPEPEA